MPVSASAKTIVIVDDESSILALLYHMLQREGFKVVPFKSATDAIAKLSAKKYKIDLMVVDLMMPGIGGYDMIKKLQEMESYRKTPIFVATARNLDSVTVDLISSEENVKGFFTKPVDPTEFTSKIHQILDTERCAPENSDV